MINVDGASEHDRQEINFQSLSHNDRQEEIFDLSTFCAGSILALELLHTPKVCAMSLQPYSLFVKLLLMSVVGAILFVTLNVLHRVVQNTFLLLTHNPRHISTGTGSPNVTTITS